MGSQDYGRVGLVFLASALVLMPVLVIAYDPASGADQVALSAGTSTSSPTALDSGSGMLTPTSDESVLDVEGLGNGLPVRGFVQVFAIYDARNGAEGGPIHFRVTGKDVGFEYVALAPPYLLDPHEPQLGGWNTLVVPNGEYTLTVTAMEDPTVQRKIRFVIRNTPN